MTKVVSLAERMAENPAVKVAVIGAKHQEIEILRVAIFDGQKQQIAGFDSYTGRLNGAVVLLLKSAIGKVNAAASTALLLQHFAPDCVINTGSAGGCDQALNVGDIVVSSEVRHHDVDITAFGYEPGQMAGMPAAYIPDDQLLAIAERCNAQMGVHCVRGLIATGDSFMSDPERVAAIQATFPGLKAVEMEAAAIAQTCYLFGTPFLVIRSLSDIAGKESNHTFAEFLETAAEHSAKMVLAIVKELGNERS